MGQEIATSSFTNVDFNEFLSRLATETHQLQSDLDSGSFSEGTLQLGCELEAWLLDPAGRAVPRNAEFIRALGDKDVVPELSRFNIEINTPPLDMASGVFQWLHSNLRQVWHHAGTKASEMDMQICGTGILPNLPASELNAGNMSDSRRYQVLNEQVLKLRGGRPINIDIEGRESLKLLHHDVMLEAATTSLQVHLKVPASKAHHYFNLSKVVSGAMVALSANSPLLFGRQLWDETRIPLFEQAVDVGNSPYSKRVTFGIRYADESIFEVFEANLKSYPILLPQLQESGMGYEHLRLHNGTIWRWNRPLVGFDEDGTPHIRIEHRVMPAGPSMIDNVANIAFYVGLMGGLINQADEVRTGLPFEHACSNFYRAARQGLQAPQHWINRRPYRTSLELLQDLFPLAEDGLRQLGLGGQDSNMYMDVIRGRIEAATNGACWQRQCLAKMDGNLERMLEVYLYHQSHDIPVHEWPVC